MCSERALWVVVLAALAGCASGADGATAAAPVQVAQAAPSASVATVAASDAGAPEAEADGGQGERSAEPEKPAEKAPSPCPDDMVFVDGSYCDKVERTCLKKEENKPNHITICHKFAKQTKCVGTEEKRAFCIDKYEYPNEKGAHPPWMVSWYDAQATCASKGKRLCYESEWVTACEGPERMPFPYGYERDNTACNIDNTYVNPDLGRAYHHDPAVSSVELERLDQSVASGSLERCVSGYGVHDMTGNFDEWVTRDSKPSAKDKSKWAGLKGGAWGHVRNACRPMTTSHPPDFTYYFISFRCCADATGHEAYAPKLSEKPPKVEPREKARGLKVKSPAGPSKRKVGPEN